MAVHEFKKTAVVTGGSSGIGREIVKGFLDGGYRVAFLGANRDRVEQTAQDIAGTLQAGALLGKVVDLRDGDAIAGFFVDVKAAFGEIGVFIHCAGISPKEEGVRIATHELSRRQFEDVIAVNLTSALLCVQQVLPAMMAARFGRLIFIGSMAARALPKFAGSAYVASKAGLAGLARTLAAEYGPFGITSNIVAPGNVLTRMTGERDSAQNLRAVQSIPIGRLGSPNDFPALVLYLASESASFVNGATIDVTGGEYLPP